MTVDPQDAAGDGGDAARYGGATLLKAWVPGAYLTAVLHSCYNYLGIKVAQK